MLRTNSPKQKSIKRVAAEARQAEADKRTSQEQLARLDALSLVAAKERVKLARRIKELERTLLVPAKVESTPAGKLPQNRKTS